MFRKTLYSKNARKAKGKEIVRFQLFGRLKDLTNPGNTISLNQIENNLSQGIRVTHSIRSHIYVQHDRGTHLTYSFQIVRDDYSTSL